MRMPAATAPAEPRVARPRSRLGTRLAVVLMPLVLIPVMLMGGAAYLRTQELIRLQVVSRLSSAVVADSRLIGSWVFAREDHLTLTAQSAAVRQALATALAGGGNDELHAQLHAALTTGAESLFSEVVVVRAADLGIVAATDPSQEGRGGAGLPDGNLPLAP